MSATKASVDEQYWVEIATELSAQFAKTAAEIDRTGQLPTDNLRALSESGLDLSLLPVELGGAGISARTFGRILFQIVRGCPSTACIWLMHIGAASSLIGLSKPSVSAFYLAEYKKGKRFANALSEPSSGNLFLNPVQSAVPVPGGYKLEGAKRFVSGSEIADYFLINVSIDGVTTFFGVKRDDTVVINDIWDALGMRGTRSQLIAFNGTILEEDKRCNPPTPESPNWIALGLPWLSLGIAQSAFDLIVSHAQSKIIPSIGKPLSHLSWVQAEVAEAHVRLQAAKRLAEHVLDLADARSEETFAASVEAKLFANRVAKEIAELGLRIGGGLAYTKALAFERYFRDAQAGGLMAYSSEVSRDFIGKKILNVEV